jgi:hypothetical protein
MNVDHEQPKGEEHVPSKGLVDYGSD